MTPRPSRSPRAPASTHVTGPSPAAGRRPGHRRRGPAAGRAARRRPASPTRTGPAFARSSTAAGGDADRPRHRRATTSTMSSPGCGAALAEGADAIIVSGGVSVGPYDVVQDRDRGDRPDRPLAGRRPARQAVRVRDARRDRPAAADVAPVRPPRQPGFELRHLRAVRAPCAPAARRPPRSVARRVDRAVLREPVTQESRPAGVHPRRSPSATMPERRSATRRPRAGQLAGGAGGQGSHVISALAPPMHLRSSRRPTTSCRPAPRSRCGGSTGPDDATPDDPPEERWTATPRPRRAPSADPRRPVRAAADGRRLGQAGHRAPSRRRGDRRGVARDDQPRHRRRRRRRATCWAWPSSPASWAPSGRAS